MANQCLCHIKHCSFNFFKRRSFILNIPHNFYTPQWWSFNQWNNYKSSLIFYKSANFSSFSVQFFQSWRNGYCCLPRQQTCHLSEPSEVPMFARKLTLATGRPCTRMAYNQICHLKKTLNLYHSMRNGSKMSTSNSLWAPQHQDSFFISSFPWENISQKKQKTSN